MNKQEHLLTILGEEGAEIAQIVSKINRFGLEEVNVLEPDGPDNRDRLVDELNDLLAVADLLVEDGIIPSHWQSAEKRSKKIEKVRRFMGYAEKIGTIK